jgi:hypothetical protein
MYTSNLIEDLPSSDTIVSQFWEDCGHACTVDTSTGMVAFWQADCIEKDFVCSTCEDGEWACAWVNTPTLAGIDLALKDAHLTTAVHWCDKYLSAVEHEHSTFEDLRAYVEGRKPCGCCGLWA